MSKVRPIFIYVFLLSAVSCTQILFEKPVPNAGDFSRTLPGYAIGTFQPEDARFDYFEIERIDKGHCIIKHYSAIPKDTFFLMVEKMNTKNTVAELKGSTLFETTNDTIKKVTNYTIESGIYYSEKKPIYEINLTEGYFIDDFVQLKKQKALLKEYQGRYYLNVVREGNWFLISWFSEGNKINIQHTVIADTAFSNNKIYYQGITDIGRLESSAYLAKPTDKEFFALMDEPKLFTRVVWIKTGTTNSLLVAKYLIPLVVGVLILLGALAFLRRKNKRKL